MTEGVSLHKAQRNELHLRKNKYSLIYATAWQANSPAVSLCPEPNLSEPVIKMSKQWHKHG